MHKCWESFETDEQDDSAKVSEGLKGGVITGAFSGEHRAGSPQLIDDAIGRFFKATTSINPTDRDVTDEESLGHRVDARALRLIESTIETRTIELAALRRARAVLADERNGSS
jgi:hypothetical protein